MKYYEDFLKLEVFNFKDAQEVVGSIENAKVLLNAYVKKGLVKRVRRDLYCAVNLENREATTDRYLIGSSINESAYLTYHSAFELHGLSHQVSFVVYVASNNKIEDFKFEGVLYKYVGGGIEEGITRYRINEKVRVTNLERTVVDSMDRLGYCGGANELDEILKICPILDELKLLKYLDVYNKKVLYKKSGYFLERHQESLGITDNTLDSIEKKNWKSEEVFKRRSIKWEGNTHKAMGINRS